MLSRFLPADFDVARVVTVIAGKGAYPVQTVAALRNAGIPVRLIGFEEETRDDLVQSFRERERAVIHVGQLGKMLKALRDFESGYAIMAGQITPKRLFHGLRPDLKTTTLLLRLKRRNAETIFGAIAAEIAAIGVGQLDARAFLDDQLADAGWMTRRGEKVEDEYLRHGIEIAREIARLDIGQGVVVRKGTVIAVEAFEGTDEMLRRAGTFKTDQMIFVKTVKPRQDYRFDVPVFGLRTLEVMRDAKIGTAALETGNVLMLEKPEVIRRAAEWGIQLLGIEAPGES
jgi:UDP-2,3-diacylglucosamine hydrolase